MAGRDGPARVHLPKQAAGERAVRDPQAPARNVRCLGAAAQLAAVHRTLRHGPALQVGAGGAAAANRTGLPDRLKSGVEALSGVSMDDVRVHYNSSKPAQLNARAYAQGGDIHLAPGQERHLPHEAWHVVQQKQGRVRPTLQLKGGVPVNDEAGLEREADRMGAKALQGTAATIPAAAALRTKPAARGPQAPVQGSFDDWIYGARQMGVEVTEGTAGPNTLLSANPSPALALLAPAVRNALWQTVNLPDHGGGAHQWHVATGAALTAAGAPFATVRSKHAWMRWGDVKMTEDHGEYEWILVHPAGTRYMSYYRTQLNNINVSRQAMRAALAGLGLGNDLIVADSANPAVGHHAFHIVMGDNDQASAQITFESTSAATTKKALYEGVSHGLNKRTQPNQQVLADATPDIIAAAQASAARFAYAGIDKELLMAYLYADLIHKMATMVPGPAWNNLAGNAKGWRNLLPKSKPFQATMQAFGRAPTAPELVALGVLLDAVRAPVLQDILDLFASKLITSGRVMWHPAHATAASDPHGDIANATAAIAPAGGAAVIAGQLANFFTLNHLTLTTEYDRVRDGFITSAAAFVPQVVRSADAGFAVHGPGTSGFATEDRGEVQTAFPGLDSVYNRIKALARRF